jgi:hypothetical protein
MEKGRPRSIISINDDDEGKDRPSYEMILYILPSAKPHPTTKAIKHDEER